MGSAYSQLAKALRADFERVMSQWFGAYRASVIRIPGEFNEPEIRRLASPILEATADMLAPRRAIPEEESPGFCPGSPQVREVEKSAAFVGANMANSDRTCFDVASLMLSLRDILITYITDPVARNELTTFGEWLSVLAVDSFSAARVRATHEKVREQLEEGTPVVQIIPEVAAVHLLGAPDAAMLDSIFGRMLLLSVRVGARALIIDTTKLEETVDHSGLLSAVERLIGHRKIAGRVLVVVVGLEDDHIGAWADLASTVGTRIDFEEHFDQAVDLAIKSAGYRLVQNTVH